MGYYRTLYVGPIVRLVTDKPGETYRIYDPIAEEFDREDAFQILQRHVGGCEGETWLSPCHHRPTIYRNEEIGNDPCYALGEIDTEAEKQWLAKTYKKEIFILKRHYKKVTIDWAIVIDGC